MKIIIVAFLFSYVLLVWFRTNAFVEYMNLMKFSIFLKIDEYNKLHKEGYDDLYVDFLHLYYRDFFIVRLVTCPVCVSFWIGVIFWLCTLDFNYLLISPLTLLFYLLFNKML